MPSTKSSKRARRNLPAYFAENLMTIVGVVLIWRGVWHLLDMLDEAFFGGNRLFTALGGIMAGLLVLYLPDKSLSEIERI